MSSKSTWTTQSISLAVELDNGNTVEAFACSSVNVQKASLSSSGSRPVELDEDPFDDDSMSDQMVVKAGDAVDRIGNEHMGTHTFYLFSNDAFNLAWIQIL